MILGIVIILISFLSYVVFIMFNLNVSYGSFEFAIIHILFIFGLFIFIFKLISKNIHKSTKTNKIKQKKVIVNNANIKPKENYKIYRVKENPKYCFKEYDDRYELYFNDNGNLKYIKTDYKKR